MGRATALVGALVLVVAGCGSSASASATPALSAHPPTAVPTAGPTAGQSPTAAPSQARMTLVKGVATCDVTSFKDHTEGANEVMVEHFSCFYATSDDRVNGMMEADFTTTFEPATAPSARREGTETISNAGGTWRGVARGSVVMWADRNGAPVNYGGGTYAGTGAYSGFVFHEFIEGDDTEADITGWIERQS